MFKVGDKVVFSNNNCALNHSIYQVTGIKDGLSRFVSVAPICGINGRLIIEGAFYVDPPYKIQHATPEEIAAGHRIDHIGDVNDMGDDSHIENHVSPNCKKFDERVK